MADPRGIAAAVIESHRVEAVMESRGYDRLAIARAQQEIADLFEETTLSWEEASDTILAQMRPIPPAQRFDPVDWMSGALFVVYGSVKKGDPRTGRPREAWQREAEQALDFLSRHGIVLAKVGAQPERRTLRAWRLSDILCRLFGHRAPQRYWTNAAGDGGGWICTRCLAELPAPEPMSPSGVGGTDG